MSDEFLGNRRKALEESFFAKQDQELLRKLQEQEAIKSRREAVSTASGITNDAVLDQLLALNMSGETVAALSLAPLVEVAWADGGVDPKERKAVLAAAAEMGIGEQSPSYLLLERWLQERPDAKLLETWKNYVAELAKSLDSEAKNSLRENILGRARSVAQAAGGILGLGPKVSRAEQAVLNDLEQAFS